MRYSHGLQFVPHRSVITLTEDKSFLLTSTGRCIDLSHQGAMTTLYVQAKPIVSRAEQRALVDQFYGIEPEYVSVLDPRD